MRHLHRENGVAAGMTMGPGISVGGCEEAGRAPAIVDALLVLPPVTTGT
jgi:hypothetical protein